MGHHVVILRDLYVIILAMVLESCITQDISTFVLWTEFEYFPDKINRLLLLLVAMGDIQRWN